VIFNGTAGGSKIIGPLRGQPPSRTGRPLAARPRFWTWSRGLRSLRQTGKSPRARTSSMRPRSTSFFMILCAAAPFRRGGSITQRSPRWAAAERTICWVSVSFVADMCGILRGLRREPPPPPQPHFGAGAGGAGSRRSAPPGRQHYRSVRRRKPVLSAIIFLFSLRVASENAGH